jgi:hypothetical protein
MIVLRGRRAGKDLAYEIDDGITTCAKLADNLELGSQFLVVCNGGLLGRVVGGETK